MSAEKMRFPHVFVLLFIVILIAALGSYILTPGQYDRVEGPGGRMIVDPDSYHTVDPTPIGFWQLFQSLHKGMVEAADIIFFIFIVGASFTVVQATGAIEASIGAVTRALQGRERLIIPVVMAIFAIGGCIFGMAEETLPFIPVMVPLALALGFDSITGVAMVLAGAGAGFTAAFMNPFTVGVAQGIAELPLYSGMGFRIVTFALFLILTVGYVFRYAGKIKENPSLSIVYEENKAWEAAIDLDQLAAFEPQHKLVLLVVLASIAMLVYGVVELGWYITEIAGLFMVMAVFAGLAGKLGVNEIAEEFVNGARDLTYGALIVGIARAILVVLTEGNIIDTILFGMASAISGLPSALNALGMYVVQCLLNFIIPSGSGQAAVSMPIMAPLSDLVGVTRQTAVLAFQFGDGISNILTPTSGYFMAGLALAKVPYHKWVKWALPLLGLQYLLGAILVTIAHLIQLGPF
ncbi:MAG: AbgT family transporter [bacterium]|jgi:uncharacterized ion transporter superfamily protein YfcC